MNSTITITREKDGIEYDIMIDVSEDGQHDIETEVVDTILEKIEIEGVIHETSIVLRVNGDEFESGKKGIALTREEDQEALAAIQKMERAYENYNHLVLHGLLSPC